EINPKKIGMILVTACICAFGAAPPDRSCLACVWRTWYQPETMTSARMMKYGNAVPKPFGTALAAERLRCIPRKRSACGGCDLIQSLHAPGALSPQMST